MKSLFKRLQWRACVAAAIVPFALFLLVIWLFSAGDPRLNGLLTATASPADLLVDHAAANLRVQVLNYGTYVFVHSILCICAILYYTTTLLDHCRKAGDRAAVRIGYAVAFAAAVGLAIAWLTIAETAFAERVVVPYRHFALLTGLDSQFPLFDGSSENFLRLGVLLPTLFGVVSVVFASAAFHQMVFMHQQGGADGAGKNFSAAVAAFKVQVSVLSVILVSSVVTARAYFHLFPSLVSPDMEAEWQAYADYAAAVSAGSGLLYTATLCAVFAPGVAVVLRGLQVGRDDQESDNLSAVLEVFSTGTWFAQTRSLLQGLLTLIAPALVSPFLEVLSSL